jgi:hypothetical protein
MMTTYERMSIFVMMTTYAMMSICLIYEMSLILPIVNENDALTRFLPMTYCETSVSLLIGDGCGSFLLLFAWSMVTSRSCRWFVSCSHWEEGLCRADDHTQHLLRLQGFLQDTFLCSRLRQ